LEGQEGGIKVERKGLEKRIKEVIEEAEKEIGDGGKDRRG